MGCSWVHLHTLQRLLPSLVLETVVARCFVAGAEWRLAFSLGAHLYVPVEQLLGAVVAELVVSRRFVLRVVVLVAVLAEEAAEGSWQEYSSAGSASPLRTAIDSNNHFQNG